MELMTEILNINYLEAYSQMKSYAVCADCRTQEYMQILITSDSDAGLPSCNKHSISYILINYLPYLTGLSVRMILSINLIYPSRTCIKVTIESEDLAFSKVPVSSEVQTYSM